MQIETKPPVANSLEEIQSQNRLLRPRRAPTIVHFVNVIDKSTGKPGVLAMREKLYAKIKAWAALQKTLVVRGPLYPPRKKGRSKRGWTTKA